MAATSIRCAPSEEDLISPVWAGRRANFGLQPYAVTSNPVRSITSHGSNQCKETAIGKAIRFRNIQRRTHGHGVNPATKVSIFRHLGPCLLHRKSPSDTRHPLLRQRWQPPSGMRDCPVALPREYTELRRNVPQGRAPGGRFAPKHAIFGAQPVTRDGLLTRTLGICQSLPERSA